MFINWVVETNLSDELFLILPLGEDKLVAIGVEHYQKCDV